MSERRIILALFALSLGLRILYAAVAGELDVDPTPRTHEWVYAEKIASGFEWIAKPVSAQSPGYPVVLALFSLLAAKQLWLVLVLQAALSAATVLLLYQMGTPLLGRFSSAAAAIWLAISVQHLRQAGLFHRDVLVVFLFVLLLSLLLRPFRRMRLAVLAGLIYAALIHVDPQFVLLLPLFAVFILFFKSHAILRLQYLFLFLATLVVALVPWTVRNRVVYKQAIPVGLEATRYLRPLKVFVEDRGTTVSNIESRIELASRTHRIENNTIEFWRFARLRDDTLPDPTRDGKPSIVPAWSRRHNIASILTYGLLLPFFLLGLVFALRNRHRVAEMLALTVIAYFLMRAYLGGNEQARLPIEPLIILLAFYGVRELVRLRHREDSPVPRLD